MAQREDLQDDYLCREKWDHPERRTWRQGEYFAPSTDAVANKDADETDPDLSLASLIPRPGHMHVGSHGFIRDGRWIPA